LILPEFTHANRVRLASLPSRCPARRKADAIPIHHTAIARWPNHQFFSRHQPGISNLVRISIRSVTQPPGIKPAPRGSLSASVPATSHDGFHYFCSSITMRLP